MSDHTHAGDKGTADSIEADDGGYWVRLVTWQALDREGACMRHCVGEGDYDDLVGGEDLVDDAIWSLRDRDGLSVLTVRIRHREMTDAKGYSNHQPGRGAAMQFRHLVAAFKAAGCRLKVSEYETEIVLLEDGRTFRHDRLPAEVQAQWAATLSGGLSHLYATTIRGSISVANSDGTTTHLGEFTIAGGASGPGGGGAGRIDLRAVEAPLRPMVDTSMSAVDDPFELTRGKPDPVVRFGASEFSRYELSYTTRSGIEFTFRPIYYRRCSPQARRAAFLARYRAAISTAAAPRPEPSVPSVSPGGGGDGHRYERSMELSIEHAAVQALQGRIIGRAFDGAVITPEDLARVSAFNSLTQRFSVRGPGGGGGNP